MHGKRKTEHLRISLEEDIQFQGVTTGLESYRFLHCALPEMKLEDVDLSMHLFGKKLAAPLLISSMTGGIEAAERINLHLAAAAQEMGVAMGVGSLRPAMDNPELARTYQVRKVAPDILLFANLGAVQLNYGYGLETCRRAVELIHADALILHLNPLQECLQEGGNTDFSGLLSKIQDICRGLSVPVIIKEVGCGISEEVAGKLAAAGVKAIDVAGAGGTSWSEIERRRAKEKSNKSVAANFAQWGIPTAECIKMARRGAPRTIVIASGGIRTGVEIAKAIALGADLAAIAGPLIRLADISAEAVAQRLSEMAKELAIAMFCIGARDIQGLKTTSRLVEVV